MLIPVILSGGAGTRLWPMSRELYPKQLLPLAGDQTMLQETIIRLRGMKEIGNPRVVCNEAHRFMVAEQLRQIGADQSDIILEPCGRNTAPAVAIAAHHSLIQEDDALMLVLPADHLIQDVSEFLRKVQLACHAAQEGALVTFGIVPTHPETGYGYIQSGKILSFEAMEVTEFVEKPNLETAKDYFDSGNYLWNSGMFLFKASRYLEELKIHRPDIHDACQNAYQTLSEDLDFLRIEGKAFEGCPSDSIDYAVMEKTDQAVVLPLDVGWNDIGSWSALWDVQNKDSNKNVLIGDVLTEDSSGCYLQSQRRLLAAVGVKNLVVVETADAILIAHKDKVQNVKAIVEQLKTRDRDEALLHRRVNRPWGVYEGIDVGERFQVKRITVNPRASLSLQKHFHRAEHWIVVKGTAKVICGADVLLLTENQSTYIPLGVVHRLENPGQIPLELIEVQSGSYLGEDDIIRLEDQYGRQPETGEMSEPELFQSL